MKGITLITLIALSCLACSRKQTTGEDGNVGTKDGVAASIGEEGTPAEKLPQKVAIDLGNGVPLDFILIRPGSFTMGSDNGSDHEKPPHKVTIAEPFYLGKYEVTQEQWKKVMDTQPSHFNGAKNPVEQVSWDECQRFVAKLNEMTAGATFRLPTEAEWELACRAGSSGWFCYGNDLEQLDLYAWYGKNAQGTTHPVGTKKPNAWGLYDMHGNVWEWCADWFGEYPTDATTNPVGPVSGLERVFRGGAWTEYDADSRCEDRMWVIPVYGDNIYRDSSLGFRVAMTTAMVHPKQSASNIQRTEQDVAPNDR